MPPDPSLIDEQAKTVLTSVYGVMRSFAHGYRTVTDAAHLDHQIQAITARRHTLATSTASASVSLSMTQHQCLPV
jgi:hypothetical protein